MKFSEKIMWRIQSLRKNGLRDVWTILVPFSVKVFFLEFLIKLGGGVEKFCDGDRCFFRASSLIFYFPCGQFPTEDYLSIVYPSFLKKKSYIQTLLHSRFLDQDGEYESDSVSVSLGDVVIDVGANLGTFSVVASKRVGDCGKIYSFEPIEEVLCYLELNKKKNDCHNIEVIPSALGEKEGSIEFFSNLSDSFEGSSKYFSPYKSKKISVPQTTLDSFVLSRGLKRVDFIKADIEGAERDMLNGARQTIKKFRPKLSIRIYHFPDDPTVIESIIHSIEPLYKITKFKDKTLYAWVD